MLYFCPPSSVWYMLLCRAHLFIFYPSLPSALLHPFLMCAFIPHLILEFPFIQYLISLATIHSFPPPFLPVYILRSLPFDFSLFSRFRHPSSPSFHISTSHEQWGGDCSASLCSHFMVWLKNWGGEGKRGREVRIQMNVGRELILVKFEVKNNKKGMKRGTWEREYKGHVCLPLFVSMMGKSAWRAALQTLYLTVCNMNTSSW